jgi:hypothetical protein
MPVGVRVPPPAPHSLGLPIPWLADRCNRFGCFLDRTVAGTSTPDRRCRAGQRQWTSPSHASKLSISRACDERHKAASCGWGLCVSPGKVGCPCRFGKSVARGNERRLLHGQPPYRRRGGRRVHSSRPDDASAVGRPCRRRHRRLCCRCCPSHRAGASRSGADGRAPARRSDGIDAATEIWQRFAIRSLLVSANLDTAARSKASAANPIGFLEKPYTPTRLFAAVATQPYRP